MGWTQADPDKQIAAETYRLGALDRNGICVPALSEGSSSFSVYTEGDDLYDAMARGIAAAREAIRLESYIFAADAVGWRLARTLSARAREGLNVRIHIDARGGAFRYSPGLQEELVRAGARLQWYQPWNWRHPASYVQRNHRKLLVIDEEEAFVGGFNVRLENSRALHGARRQRDTHIRIGPELAWRAAALFDALWDDAATSADAAHAIPESVSGVDALLVPNASRRCRQRLACLHAALIRQSSQYAYLTTPFFGPGTIVAEALCAAARNGVDVRLLVPRRSDPRIAGWATRAAYATLLEAGVRIFEYLPRPLHAKTSVVDGDWAIVGSANLDHLSLFINQELVVAARSRDLSLALRDQYLRDLLDAAEVSGAVWSRRPLRERCVESIGWVARSML